MIEQAALSDIPHPAPEPAPLDGPNPRVAALEERVRQLEQLVATLQDTHALEERVVERVSARVKPAPSGSVRESAGFLLEAGRQLLPSAVSVLAEQGGQAEVPAATPAQPATSPPAPTRRRPWLLFDAYAELRAIVRMYLDPRFRLTWAARVVPLILLPAIALSGLWLPGTTLLNKITLDIVGTLLEKVVDLLLAFVLFQVVHREATRYRTTSPDLPPSLRL
jgi:hypothetical protein